MKQSYSITAQHRSEIDIKQTTWTLRGLHWKKLKISQCIINYDHQPFEQKVPNAAKALPVVYMF